MIYRAIGLMSGSSLDGLDIVFIEFLENGGKWNFEILHADCYPYPESWIEKLKNATSLSALDYQLLHTEYGHYLGEQVNHFIESCQLHYKVALVASHGHTSFHIPEKRMTAQLGDGAAIAAVTQLPVVTDLRALDVAFGGQGAPIVPVGEKLLLGDHKFFLNLGGIANISIHTSTIKAFDICPANRVLNMLANEAGKAFDEDGLLAKTGTVNQPLLEELNQLHYYSLPAPKSLANSFGTDTVYTLLKKHNDSIVNLLSTYTQHIVEQIKNAVQINSLKTDTEQQLLVTGGGAFNVFLIEKLQSALKELNIKVVVPDAHLVKYKEALIIALVGVLRWREEYNVLSSVTGAVRNSVGGALWVGAEE